MAPKRAQEVVLMHLVTFVGREKPPGRPLVLGGVTQIVAASMTKR